jgi:myosin heavy subunit
MNYFVSEYKNMSSDERDAKFKELELKMQNLETERDEIIQEKSDKIDELIARMDQEREERQSERKRMEEERQSERKRMEEQNKRQEQMLQRLGITLDDVAQQNDELLEKNDELVEKVETVQTKLNIAVVDRAPQPALNSKKERFILVKRDDPDYPYYTIRAQHVSAQAALRKQRSCYSEVTILLDLPFHPNSKTLYVRIKDQLKQKGVEFKLCKLSLTDAEKRDV